MSISATHDCLSRYESAVVTVELIGHRPAAALHDVFEEPLHVVALQQPKSFSGCEGRYRVPSLGQDYSSIGRMLVLPAAIPLEVRTPERPDQVVRCMFSPEKFSQFGGGVDLYDNRVLATCLNLRNKEMADMLTLLGKELRAPGLASAALVESLGVTLMIQLARHVSANAAGESVHRGGLSRKHLRLITEAVEGEIKCPSLSELSTLSGLSLRHLTRAFKQTTGLTVYSYIEQVRLQKAEALLADTDLLMKDIAYRLGFSCASSLSAAFRKLTGESPQAYRKRMRGARRTASPTGTRH